MKKVVVLFFLILCFSSLPAEKHALIIAIGDYPISYNGYRPAGSWRDLSSNNDVELIKDVLLEQKFSEQNINIIENKQATKSDIVQALKDLNRRAKKGDVVMVHYSGHGQQIWDAGDDADENDGYDEALCPYDAFPLFDEGKYHGESHLRDDEFGSLLNDIRNKIKNTGQLFVLLDCCHSATASRGEIGDEIVRGGVGPLQPADYAPAAQPKNIGSGMLEGYTKANKDAAAMILISGARAEEQNYEYRGYGSLSYAFSKAMKRLGSDMTYRQLFASIESQMAVIASQQHPTIEGEADLKLFKNEYVKQQPFHKVKNVDNDVMVIEGGTLNGIFEGTTFNIVPTGSRNLTSAKVLGTATVTRSTITESVLKLDEELYGKPQEYWAFVDKSNFGDIHLNVYFEKSFKSADLRKNITNYLAKNNLGAVVDMAKYADIVLAQNSGSYTRQNTEGGAFLLQNSRDFSVIGKPILNNDTTDIMGATSNALFNYAQGKYLSSLEFNDRNYEFDIALIPVDYNKTNRKIEKIYKDYKPTAGAMRMRPFRDATVMRIINKGTQDLYFSVVEINSNGEVFPSMPSASCRLEDDQRLVKAGDTLYFTSCVYTYAPPYEKLILKAFGTPTPIDLKSTVTSRGDVTSHDNVIEKFFKNTYVRSRGSVAAEPVPPSKAYTTQLVYEIIKNE